MVGTTDTFPINYVYMPVGRAYGIYTLLAFRLFN
jgi:hypothetical protein